jgi:hypothetical protein
VYQPIQVLGRPVSLDYARPRGPSVGEPNPRLFIAGFSGSEEDLSSAFKDYESDVISIHISKLSFIEFVVTLEGSSFFIRVVIVKNAQTGQSTNAGFINFATVEKATEALEAMNNRELASGQILKLAFARVPIRGVQISGAGRHPQIRRGYGLTKSRREDGGGGGYRDAGGGGYRDSGGRQY